MSKSVIDNSQVSVNVAALLEDVPMNENVTMNDLNNAASEREVLDRYAAAKIEETKEKKEKFSLTRNLAPVIEKIEKALSGNASQIKALDKTLGVLLSAGLDTSAVLAKIDALRKESVEITPEFEAEVGRALIEAVKVKNAQ